MSLGTLEKIRSLQRKLYVKAKAEPAFRFYVLYDKICRDDILLHAYKLARANAGAPGVDGVTFATIEEASVEAWLVSLREDLVKKTYRPDPLRRVMIPKANGDGERALGIPTIRDRVVQTAAKIVLEPVFEADFEDTAYGYRPRSGALAAVKEVHRHICHCGWGNQSAIAALSPDVEFNGLFPGVADACQWRTGPVAGRPANFSSRSPAREPEAHRHEDRLQPGRLLCVYCARCSSMASASCPALPWRFSTKDGRSRRSRDWAASN